MQSRYSATIAIDGRMYSRNPEVDRYQIPYAELGGARMGDIPRNSHLEILDLPVPVGIDVEFFAVNGSSDDTPYFFIYGGPQVQCETEEVATRVLAKMRRTFPELWDYDGLCPFSYVTRTRPYTHISLNFDEEPETLIKPIFDRLVEKIARLADPNFSVFICHASEDKPKARSLGRALKSIGSDVWLDEWEIKVGDSIVQRINEALAQATHLVVLLSETSCQKPWVTKEWSAALMRQLADNSITVLPVRLDDHPVPAILADLRYADCRRSIRHGIAELRQAIVERQAV